MIMNPPAPQAATTTGAAPSALDPTIVNLAKAIRAVETRGQKDPYTAKGASGEYGAYQYTPGTWDADVVALTGKKVPLEKADRLLQNEVAYKKLESLKKQGHNVGQIASIWNSGSPEWEGKVGVNKHGVRYDVPKYVDAVATAYQGFKAGNESPTLKTSPSTVGEEQRASPAEMADMESAQRYGAFFPAATGEGAASAALKTAGNLPSSAFNFAKGAVQTMNPVQTLDTASKIPGEFSALARESGGVIPALAATAKEIPGTAYETLVPEFAREGIKAIGGFAKHPEEILPTLRNMLPGEAVPTTYQKDIDEPLRAAQRAVTNDPFGQVAPLVIYGKLGAKGLDKTGITKGAEAAYDAGISKTAQAAIKPAKYAFGAPVRAVQGMAGYGAAKITGLNKETMRTISENPADFTPEKVGQMSRQTLGEEVGGKLGERIDALDETGAAYRPIRESGAKVKVEPDFLGRTLQETTGLTLKKGKFSATAKSAVDSPTDVGKVQRLYDAWQPYFKNGSMTADDFLTLRSKLAQIANYEGIGKSKPLDAAASRTRGALNTEYRSQIPKLEDLDADFASMSTELKALRKGLIDRDGNLLDAAVNRIANAAGKGKDAQLARLEEISPGIGLKIRQLKAVEDIQNIHKVGTYTKSAIEGGGLVGGIATGNVPLIVASVLSLLMSQPEVAVRVIRTYGQSKALAGAVLDKLGEAAGTVNNITDPRKSILYRDTKELPVSAGLSIKDVSGGKPSAFGPKKLSPSDAGQMAAGRYTGDMKTDFTQDTIRKMKPGPGKDFFQNAYNDRAALDATEIKNPTFVLDTIKKMQPGEGKNFFQKAFDEKYAEQLMKKEGQIWDKLGIRSGGQLEANPALMERYAAEVQKILPDTVVGMQGVMDILENENFHTLVEQMANKRLNKARSEVARTAHVEASRKPVEGVDYGTYWDPKNKQWYVSQVGTGQRLSTAKTLDELKVWIDNNPGKIKAGVFRP